MKKTVLALFAAVMLVVSTAAIVNASSHTAHELTEIPIEAAFHKLGDPESTEGSSWRATFRIPDRPLADATSAHVELYLVSSSPLRDSVGLNDRFFALPASHGLDQTDVPFISKVAVSIPLGVLRSGANSITFSAGAFPDMGDNTHDDFEFGEVVLILSS